jgi:hypothetical protein
MTRFDLHPEELLERAARGAASPAELTRLDQHLAECAVCRVERALVARAALDSAPLRDEKLVVARLKRDVLARLAAPAGRPRRSPVVLALAVGLLASAAAAGTVAVIRHADSAQVEPMPAPTPKKDVNAVSRLAQLPAEAAVDPPGIVDPPKAAPTPVTAPSSSTEHERRALEPLSASELFSKANQARREGKPKEAVRLYRSLQERFAGSSEELVSRVALGRLLLDRLGDSRGALVQFNSYLASPGGGVLREEAMVGRALALGRLGRGPEERAAWRGLLETFPKSAHEKRARARLGQLDAPAAGSP